MGFAPAPLRPPSASLRSAAVTTRLHNFYDDWSLDLLSSSQSAHSYDELVLPLDEDSIAQCLEELMDSEYGQTMFGRHDLPASVGYVYVVDSVTSTTLIIALLSKGSNLELHLRCHHMTF